MSKERRLDYIEASTSSIITFAFIAQYKVKEKQNNANNVGKKPKFRSYYISLDTSREIVEKGSMTWKEVKENQDMQTFLKEMKNKKQVSFHLWHHNINQQNLQPGISI
jgi:hypothetical protein